MPHDADQLLRSGDLDVSWGLRVDALTSVMLVVITTVSALVHLYSWGYMSEDPDQPRFFAYLSFFTFAMLALVTAGCVVATALLALVGEGDLWDSGKVGSRDGINVAYAGKPLVSVEVMTRASAVREISS